MNDDRPKILLVDDYPANLLALEAGLGDLGVVGIYHPGDHLDPAVLCGPKRCTAGWPMRTNQI
jgi:CheY-like chemotaxis protein